MRIILLLLLAGILPAQSLVPRLADEFCACMQTQIGEVQTVDARATARGCLAELADSNAGTLATEFDLDAAISGDRDHLALLLTDELAQNCPFLQTLRGTDEPEYRWNDRPPKRSRPRRFVAPKEPPPITTGPRAGPVVRTLRGRYLGVTASGAVALQAEGDAVLELTLAGGRLRGDRPGVGERALLICRYRMVGEQLLLVAQVIKRE